jgi:hypothetical protein
MTYIVVAGLGQACQSVGDSLGRGRGDGSAPLVSAARVRSLKPGNPLIGASSSRQPVARHRVNTALPLPSKRYTLR